MSVANSGFMLRMNGDAIVIANISGRGLTCGHTCAPRAQPSLFRSTLRLCPPVVLVSNAP